MVSEGLRPKQLSASRAVTLRTVARRRSTRRLTVWCHTVKFNCFFTTFPICPQGRAGRGAVRDIWRNRRRWGRNAAFLEKESEGEKCGGRMIRKRMSGRGEKERQEIKKAFPAERKKRTIHPPSDKNDVCYDSDRVKWGQLWLCLSPLLKWSSASHTYNILWSNAGTWAAAVQRGEEQRLWLKASYRS